MSGSSPETRPLRGGLVGLGRMGLTHLAILNTHPHVKWTAICDTAPFVLKQLQSRIGFEPYADSRQMIDEQPFDFVVIATPTSLHADTIRQLIERRIPFFVEKPLTLTGTESERLSADAARAGLVTQVGYVNRFNEVFAEARRCLRAGLIGDVLHFRCDMWGRTVLRPVKQGWRAKRKEGGGCLLEFGSHCVDLAHFMVGVPDSVAGSRLQRIYSASVEDIVISTFLYRSGTVGQISVNWSDESVRKPMNRVEIFGTRGKLVALQHELHLYLREADPEEHYTKGWNTRYVTDLARGVRFYLRGNEFTSQLDHFVQCVRDGAGSPVCSLQDGALADVVLEKIVRDAGQEV